jgi:competence protein ComEC
VAAAFAAGALVGQWAAIGVLPLLGLATLVLLLASAPSRLSQAAVMAAAVAGGAGAAGIEGQAYDITPLRIWVGENAAGEQPALLRGVAAADGIDAQGRRSLVLDVETVSIGGEERPMAGRARIEVGGSAPLEGAERFEVSDGDRLSLWATLGWPRGFGNPGSFDSAAHARRQGIHAAGYCKSARLIRSEGVGDIGWLRSAASRVRRWGRRAFERYMLPGTEQGLARAMVLGDRTGVDPDTADAFRVAGTYHILAISGAQVALVAGMLAFVLSRLLAGPWVSAAVPL